jgi:hypothetical protein
MVARRGNGDHCTCAGLRLGSAWLGGRRGRLRGVGGAREAAVLDIRPDLFGAVVAAWSSVHDFHRSRGEWRGLIRSRGCWFCCRCGALWCERQRGAHEHGEQCDARGDARIGARQASSEAAQPIANRKQVETASAASLNCGARRHTVSFPTRSHQLESRPANAQSSSPHKRFRPLPRSGTLGFTGTFRGRSGLGAWAGAIRRRPCTASSISSV